MNLPSPRPALLTVSAMAATITLVALVEPHPGALVLAAVLALTLSRNRLAASWRGRAEAALVLPALAVATHLAAELLKSVPWAGAVTFTAAMGFSIWLRRFGPTASRIGTLIALPFVTLLIVPGGGAGTSLPGAAAIAVLALAMVTLLRWGAVATGFLPADEAMLPQAEEGSAPTSTLRPIPSTRMALQMVLALGLAFVLGAAVFGPHVTWVVLTAFVVCSGNRGRADVAFKSVLRVAGAGSGTVVALVLGHVSLHGAWLAATLLGILGIGLWLRESTYAAWALAMTLVVALLQDVVYDTDPEGSAHVLSVRLLAIIFGAGCGLAASWWLLPIRSEPIVRRRIADLLSVLQAYLAEPSPELNRKLALQLARLEEIAPPWMAHDRLLGWFGTSPGPGTWIRVSCECVALAQTHPPARPAARQALGAARKALKEPPAILPALTALRGHLGPQSAPTTD